MQQVLPHVLPTPYHARTANKPDEPAVISELLYAFGWPQ